MGVSILFKTADAEEMLIYVRDTRRPVHISTYIGTSNIAVSDTSHDVRRTAVTLFTFLLFRNLSQVLWIIQLLSDSHNPHVY